MKQGEIYINKTKPYFRKNEPHKFVITKILSNKGFACIVWQDGETDIVGREWIAGDCELVATFESWQKAINSIIFQGD